MPKSSFVIFKSKFGNTSSSKTTCQNFLFLSSQCVVHSRKCFPPKIKRKHLSFFQQLWDQNPLLASRGYQKEKQTSTKIWNIVEISPLVYFSYIGNQNSPEGEEPNVHPHVFYLCVHFTYKNVL